MRILSVSLGADVGGSGYGLGRSFEKFSPDTDFKSICAKKNYLLYPYHASWSNLDKYWRRADIVHLHSSLRALDKYGAKPFVLHHHGTKYRDNPEHFNTEVKNRAGEAIVSTLDLLEFGDNLTWVPSGYPLSDIAAYRYPNHGRKLRVGHSPTNRSIKNTEEFLEACKKLNVEPVLMEKMSWNQCLTLKGTVDIFYDQVVLGYGASAIEAWAMNIPVICGASDYTLDKMRTEFGDIPFYQATNTVESIADAISALSDEKTRNEYRVKGLNHVTRWHDGRESVRRLTDIYQRVLDKQ